MNVKLRLAKGLKQARDFSEAMLSKYTNPKQWTHQVHPAANHALWFAGHMTVTDNFFIGALDPSKGQKLDEFEKMFGMGSKPTSDPAAYPPAEKVLAAMRERRGTLLSLLEALPESELEKQTALGNSDFLPDKLSCFEIAVWHEGIHSGQLSVASRSLGFPPIFG